MDFFNPVWVTVSVTTNAVDPDEQLVFVADDVVYVTDEVVF
jgi:hypothetical protein